MPLFLVSTPVGNLSDITLRALEVLKSADLVAAEDTRHTSILFKHYGLSKRLVSFHDHNERQRSEELIPLLQQGQSIAVVSDAGTPGIADPAFHLTRRCIQENIPVIPVPGPSSVLAALSGAGLPMDRFIFENFLPAKSGQRRKKLESLKGEVRTLVFFESPYRLLVSLKDMLEIYGDVRAAVARELTKKFETFHRGCLSELVAQFEREAPRGEMVVVVNQKFNLSNKEIIS